MNTQKQMTQLIAQWRASGLTKVAFCREHQISVQKIDYWLKKQQQAPTSNPTDSELHFFSIEDSAPKSTTIKANGKPTLSIELPNGVTINFFSC